MFRNSGWTKVWPLLFFAREFEKRDPFGKPVSAPDQVRGRLFPDSALEPKIQAAASHDEAGRRKRCGEGSRRRSGRRGLSNNRSPRNAKIDVQNFSLQRQTGRQRHLGAAANRKSQHHFRW